MSIICKKSLDNSFITNKEYELINGFLYTEQDISINTKAYQSEDDAILDLNNKGYEFIKSKMSSSSNFTTNDIFGDIFSSMGYTNTNQKRSEAESLKNDILRDILNGSGFGF